MSDLKCQTLYIHFLNLLIILEIILNDEHNAENNITFHLIGLFPWYFPGIRSILDFDVVYAKKWINRNTKTDKLPEALRWVPLEEIFAKQWRSPWAEID